MNMKRLLLFLVAGGLAATANIVSRILFGMFMPYGFSIFLAYCVGLASGYTLNRATAFNDMGGASFSEFVKFVIVNLVSLPIILYASYALRPFLTGFMNQSEYLDTASHTMAVGLGTLVSFFGHRYFTFR